MFRNPLSNRAEPAEKRKLKIAYLADPESANGWYRAIEPMTAMAGRGHDVRPIAKTRRSANLSVLRGVDIVLIHRQADEVAKEILVYAKRAKFPVVWDNDDDLAALPARNVGALQFKGLHGRRKLESMRSIVSQVDVASAPSSTLLRRFRAMGAKRTHLLENYVRGSSMFQRRGEQTNRLVIGWVAGREHHLDLETVPILDALTTILKRHEGIEVQTIGLKLPITHARYSHTAAVEFSALPSAVAAFDVGIAPLGDIDFNHARSNIKLKEYAVLGIPWLASPVGPYAGLGHREGGVLVENDRWENVLEQIVCNPNERRRLAHRAAKWGERQTIERNVVEWERMMHREVKRCKQSAGIRL